MKEGKMELTEEFGRYLGHISESLGRSERKVGWRDYCRGLMLPLQRKSIEPLAAAIDPYPRAGAAPVAAPFRGRLALVGRSRARRSGKLGAAEDGRGAPGVGVPDRRRFLHAQARDPLGWRRLAVLRSAGQ